MGATWWTPRAVVLHAVVLVLVPVFAVLCWWQVGRALGGNTLSWAYAFEWPFFAGYAIYVWWRLVHDSGTPGAAGSAGTPGAAGSVGTAVTAGAGGSSHDARSPDGDADLAAYNQYLAALAATGRRKHW